MSLAEDLLYIGAKYYQVSINLYDLLRNNISFAGARKCAPLLLLVSIQRVRDPNSVGVFVSRSGRNSVKVKLMVYITRKRWMLVKNVRQIYAALSSVLENHTTKFAQSTIFYSFVSYKSKIFIQKLECYFVDWQVWFIAHYVADSWKIFSGKE